MMEWMRTLAHCKFRPLRVFESHIIPQPPRAVCLTATSRLRRPLLGMVKVYDMFEFSSPLLIALQTQLGHFILARLPDGRP